MKRLSIPVLYYHRIGAPDPIHLSIPTALFARQMAFLAHRGVRTLSMAELLDHVHGRRILHHPSVAITFDDGFRDNLTEAFPILERHGFQATIFASPGLLRPDDAPPVAVPRPFTQAHLAAQGGDRGDFCSRAELQTMTRSGLVQIHPHGWSHRQVFTGNTVTGFFPADDGHWGIVSAYQTPLPEGNWPVFPRQPGLAARGWRPLLPALRERGFPLPAADREALNRLRGTSLPETCFHKETEAEYRNRVADELSRSRTELAPFHPMSDSVMCWPWGAFSPELVAMAREAGYVGAVSTRTGANLPGSDPMQMHRFPVKKGDLLRFALGLWLRLNPSLARLYGALHGRL